MRKAILPLMLAALLGGCAIGPEYRAERIDMPETWPRALETDAGLAERAAWSRWWTLFDEPALDALVKRAMAQNLDVRTQSARIRQARAELGLARAEQWPTISAQAEASRQRQPASVAGADQRTDAPDSVTGNMFAVSGVLNYELDLWGRLARESESAEALLEQSVFAADAVRLNVVADVVTTYFSYLAAREQLAVARDDLAAREETLRLQSIRHEAGSADELTLRQAETEVAVARSQLPLREEAVRSLETALGLLVGMSPAELFERSEEAFDSAPLEQVREPGLLPAYLPAELIERRPDVRAAEQQLRAATAQVGVAEAVRLPSLNLTALLGSSALEASNLLTAASETWSLGASLAGPLLDFGASGARIEGAEARLEQTRLNYRAVVNQVFAEVRDALVLHDSAQQRLDATRTRRKAAERTLELAQIRYDEGYIGFLELLDARRNMLAAQTALTEARRDRLHAVAGLFKALGGGWSENDSDEKEVASPTSDPGEMPSRRS